MNSPNRFGDGMEGSGRSVAPSTVSIALTIAHSDAFTAELTGSQGVRESAEFGLGGASNPSRSMKPNSVDSSSTL
jgi:hypothetical protein